jgi:hypothetical protein
MNEIVPAKNANYPSNAERLFWDRAVDVAESGAWDLDGEIRITVMVRLAALLARWAA